MIRLILFFTERFQDHCNKTSNKVDNEAIINEAATLGVVPARAGSQSRRETSRNSDHHLDDGHVLDSI